MELKTSKMMSNCVVRRTRYKKTQKRRFRVLIRNFRDLVDSNIKFSSFLSPQAVIMKKRPLVCQFASPLDVDIHNTPQVSRRTARASN